MATFMVTVEMEQIEISNVVNIDAALMVLSNIRFYL